MKKYTYSKTTIEDIRSILNAYPEEDTFGTESFGWVTVEEEEEGVCDYGYIYPARGGWGNMGCYHSRKELEQIIKEGGE